MTDPHVPRVADGRLYGRGAYDMKGGLAACLLAGAAAAGAGFAGDVLVAAVSDEEFASAGCRSVAERFGGAADAAIVTEPTALRACVAHKGFAWATIEARGRAAHGSRPDLGADAIVHMGAVLAEVSDLDRRLGDREAHPLLGRGSVHASLIAGGQELSSYPERCALEIERRTLPGETAAAIEAEIADAPRPGALARAGPRRERARDAGARAVRDRPGRRDRARRPRRRRGGDRPGGRGRRPHRVDGRRDPERRRRADRRLRPGRRGRPRGRGVGRPGRGRACARTLAAVAAGWCR